MTITSTVALFSTMFFLALVPGPGVFVVVARALSSGFRHGFVTAIGIVCGDFVFIILAVYGLLAIAETMGSLFVVIKYLGALYLVWLGVKLLQTNFGDIDVRAESDGSYWGNFFMGLVTTLGNPKAILFYLSFFPAFLDLSTLSSMDVGVILLVATVAVGGVMTGYAYMASKTKSVFRSNRVNKSIGLLSGGALIGSGALLALKN